MKRTVVVASLLALGVTAAIAQSNVVEQRQSLMKDLGAQSRIVGGMLREQASFDLAKVQTALKTISDHAQKAGALFPESSKNTDLKNEALPAIWENKAAFDAGFEKMSKDAQAALVAIKDEATFKTEFPKVLQNCGTCHKTFRKS